MDSNSSKEARKRLSHWISFTQNAHRPEFEKFRDTFLKWANEITESFDNPYTNGYTGC